MADQGISTGAWALPRLGVGTWAWGDRATWGFDRGYGLAEVEGAFQASVEAGVSLFDTAEVYGSGKSERILGDLVRRWGKPLIVATKFAPYRLGAAAVHRALEGSLSRLGLQRVDLYQVHWPPIVGRIDTWMEALAAAVQEGRVRAVGVSNFGAEQMRRAQDALARHAVPLASNQVEYSLLHRAPETNGVLRACRELDITLIAYSPLAMGLLSGKYDAGADRLPRRLGRYLRAWPPATIAGVVSLLQAIGQKHGRTPAQVALRWLLQQPGVVVIPGAKDATQARENAGALGWELAPEEMAALDQATRRRKG
jgi:aryl-alcohol dehydrogenase-like predicted oxidoreductase